MAVYYNEFDPFAAEWLRKLMQQGLIPDGEIDARSIVEVQPDDLRRFSQCHFFAGIGGWSHALRLAGWPDDRQVWTGSCPCQPFSVAGKGKGTADDRHLWPVLFDLIRQVRPVAVMGEQVAGKAGYGWFDGVQSDLEAEGYASRAVDVPACAVDAPHIRQRLYWVALANAHDAKRGADSAKRNDSHRQETKRDESDGDVAERRPSDVADADDPRRQGRQIHSERADECSAWSDGVEWRRGADGKSRRVKSGVRLLADGVPNRVGRLRGYGNAIVPPLAAEVIKAFMEATS